MQLSPHVFERDSASGPRTSGPNVLTWAQVTAFKKILFTLNETGLAELQTAWSRRSTQTWNPFAAPGFNAAKLAVASNDNLSEKYHVPAGSKVYSADREMQMEDAPIDVDMEGLVSMLASIRFVASKSQSDDAVLTLREKFPSLEVLVSQHDDNQEYSTTAALGEWVEQDDHIQKAEEEVLLAARSEEPL